LGGFISARRVLKTGLFGERSRRWVLEASAKQRSQSGTPLRRKKCPSLNTTAAIIFLLARRFPSIIRVFILPCGCLMPLRTHGVTQVHRVRGNELVYIAEMGSGEYFLKLARCFSLLTCHAYSSEGGRSLHVAVSIADYSTLNFPMFIIYWGGGGMGGGTGRAG
jgi:hypothetical protein